jgi:hypothetical protein
MSAGRDHFHRAASDPVGRVGADPEPTPAAPPRPALPGPSPRFSRPWRQVDQTVASRLAALEDAARSDDQLTLDLSIPRAA